jgi:hypothetical protein
MSWYEGFVVGLPSSSHASFLQPRETSRKRKAREYEHCFRALALVERERGPIKTAMSLMELGTPNRALLGSSRNKRHLALKVCGEYAANLDAAIEALVASGKTVVHFCDDLTRAFCDVCAFS